MLEKVTHIAEQAASGISRRRFLGQFGRGAAATAAALAGVLALPVVTRAGKTVQICSENSATGCQNAPVGSACGRRTKAVCKPVNGRDKSPIVDCVCKRQGSKPKPPPRR